jgi:hypothetical protein
MFPPGQASRECQNNCSSAWLSIRTVASWFWARYLGQGFVPTCSYWGKARSPANATWPRLGEGYCNGMCIYMCCTVARNNCVKANWISPAGCLGPRLMTLSYGQIWAFGQSGLLRFRYDWQEDFYALSSREQGKNWRMAKHARGHRNHLSDFKATQWFDGL